MAKIIFTEDEYLTMAMFEADTRKKVLADLTDCLHFITEDQELTDLVKSTINKLKQISDEDYKNIDLCYVPGSRGVRGQIGYKENKLNNKKFSGREQ